MCIRRLICTSTIIYAKQEIMLVTAFIFLSLTHFISALDVEAFQKYLKMGSGTYTKNNSERCEFQKKFFLDGINKRRRWAMEMLDSSGNIPVGILKGNVVDLGFYDQCLEIRHEIGEGVINGKYCHAGLLIPYAWNKSTPSEPVNNAIAIQITNMGILNTSHVNVSGIEYPSVVTTSVCIPDACRPSDIFGNLGFDGSCSTKYDLGKLSAGEIIFIVMIGIVSTFIVFSTAYDIYIWRYGESKPRPLLIAFSLYTNGYKIFNDCNSSNQIPCLGGVKVFSLLWVIVFHRYIIMEVSGIVNYSDILQWRNRWQAHLVYSGHLAVDSFLFVSGILRSYTFLKCTEKPKVKFNVFSYYLHRYLRLTPALAALWFLEVTIKERIGSGPMWRLVTNNIGNNCLKKWWQVFFYLHNYFDHNNMCFAHIWYVSMDMQLFVISPLILLPMLRRPKLMKQIVMPLITIISIVFPVVIMISYNLRYWTPDYYKYYYYVTHTRLPPWLLGLSFGAYALGETKRKLNKNIRMMMWCATILTIMAIILNQVTVINKYSWIGTLYMGFQRPAWSLCLWWVCFACINGYGGVINSLLSLPALQVLSKLTYSVYLLHLPLQLSSQLRRRTLTIFDDYSNIHLVASDIVFSLALGIIWTLAFEMPFVAIEKLIFAKAQGADNFERGNEGKYSNVNDLLKAADQNEQKKWY